MIAGGNHSTVKMCRTNVRRRGCTSLAAARQWFPLHPVGEALSLPLRRSRLGSLSEGAAERSEAEGVPWDEWYAPPAFTMPCRGRLAGDPPFPGAKHPCLPWKGRCRTNVRRRGLFVNRARKPLSQPVRAASSPFRGAKAASPLGSPTSRPPVFCPLFYHTQGCNTSVRM